MGRKIVWGIVFWWLASSSVWAMVLDAPHNESNGIHCGVCHTYSLWWQFTPTAANRSASAAAVCATCHGGSGSPSYPTAPLKSGHSYLSMGSAHDGNTGTWSTNCVDCHDPHFQPQLDWAATNANDLYLVQGTIGTAASFVANPNGTTTFAYTLTAGGDPAWSDPANWVNKTGFSPGRGLILVDNRVTADNTYPVVAATASTITVRGGIASSSASHTFGLVYGQLVKSTVATPPTPANPTGVARTVKFFNPKKLYTLGGYTEPSMPPQGICQVCHSKTSHWSQDGTLTNHNKSSACTACHTIAKGFQPTAPDHSLAIILDTPLCVTCHPAKDPLAVHKSTCTKCHTSPPTLEVATNKRYVTAISRGECIHCHAAYFSGHTHLHHPAASDRTPALEPPALVCANCHGLAFSGLKDYHLNLVAVKRGQVNGAGTIGAAITCLSCHASPNTAVGVAINAAKGVGGRTVICSECHGVRATDHPSEVMPDHTWLLKTATTCLSCHDPAGNKNIVTDLHKANCNDCHDPGTFALRKGSVGNATLHVKGTSSACTVCHPERAANFFNHRFPDHPARGWVAKTTNSTCDTCHRGDDTIGDTHKNNCGDCHTATTGVLRTGANGDAKLAPTGGNCATCHPTRATDFKNHLIPDHFAKGLVVKTADSTCDSCHTSTDTIGVTHKNNCANCHTAITGVLRTGVIGDATLAPTGGNCHSCHSLTAHDSTASHNHRQAVLSCATCHAVGSTAAIDTLHKQLCTTCHSYAGSKLDPVVVAATIAKGRGATGVDVFCTDCHTVPHDTNVAHNNRQVTVFCATCHAVSTSAAIDTLHKADCATCHGYAGTKLVPTTVAATIAKGKGANGVPVFCVDCHTVTHDSNVAHNHRQVAPACAVCHQVETIAEVDTVHRAECGTCHGYNGTKLNPTVVANAIATGKGATGADVNCQTCHTAGHVAIANKLTIHNIVTSGCGRCHTPTYSDSAHNNLRAVAPCSGCHLVADFNGFWATHKSDCFKCHLSSRPEVLAAINGGRVDPGVEANCVSCHGAIAHDSNTAHNHRQVVALCANCHQVSSNAAIDTLHKQACTTCHAYAGTKLNPTVVAATIAAGRGATGGDVNCQSCHTTNHGTTAATVAPQHDRFIGVTTCAACHTSATAEQRITLHPACATCHSSTLSTVAATISAGRAGVTVSCMSCHTGATTAAPLHGTTAATAAAAHDQFNAASVCANCHSAGTAAQRISLHPSCTTCHASTNSTVIATIASGRAGSAVTCTNCHSGDPTNIAAFHHANPKAVAGICTWCHGDPRESWTTMRPGDNGSAATFPTQMACKNCHVRVSGTTIYIDKLSYTNYRTDPTRTVQHTLNGITAGSVNNYGICMSCHNGSKAIRVELLHAKPNSAPSSDRYDNMSKAPGRGTYNLFWSEFHGDKDNDVGNKDNESNQDQFKNPIISYQKIAVPCASFNTCSGSTSKQVPVLPAVANANAGSGGSEPPPPAPVTHIYFNTSSTCSACHLSLSEDERTVGLHVACSNCHGSTLSSVSNTITNGIAGTTVSCENCHDGSANGAPLHGVIAPEEVAARHDRLSAYPACGACHNFGDGSFLPIYALHRSDCGTCHSSSDATVQNTIATGKSGTAVNCTNCHGTSHHESPQAREGNCTYCHADPRGGWSTIKPGDNGGTSTLPTQLGCATCHVRVVGSTLYIDKLTYATGNYGTAPTRTAQHTFTNTTGYIYNYGACFSCHNGTKATKVNVWHAKPATAASSNRYTAMAGIPGRGIFNVFWSANHGSKNASFGSKSFNGNQNDFQTPAAGYSFKLAVPCGVFNGCSGGATVSVPVLTSKPAPTVTSGGGSGGSQAPLPLNDSYSVVAGSNNNIFSVLANDTDPNGDALTISAVSATSNGGVVVNNASTLSYTPAAGYTGAETFTYTVRDPGGLTATGTVTVSVGSSGGGGTVQNINQWASLATGSTGTFTAGSGANRLVLVAVHYEYSSNTTPTVSVTYGGKTLTQIGKSSNTRNDVWLGYLKESDITGRSGNTVAASFSSTPTSYSIAAATYSGVEQSGPIQGSAVNQASSGGSSANPSFSGVAVASKGYVLYAITANENASFTPPAGYTEHYDLNNSGNNYRYSTASRAITAAGTESKTITMSSERWGLVAVALKPAL